MDASRINKTPFTPKAQRSLHSSNRLFSLPRKLSPNRRSIYPKIRASHTSVTCLPPTPSTMSGGMATGEPQFQPTEPPASVINNSPSSIATISSLLVAWSCESFECITQPSSRTRALLQHRTSLPSTAPVKDTTSTRPHVTPCSAPHSRSTHGEV